ncbi:MAG: DUF2059 domain-containing protein [Acidobacteriota bacterium]|nr:DUF2059 domain-containing protein [Acidobacteriota bacterium]
MKRIAALLLLLCLPLASRADEASHKAKAQEMLTILHLDRMVNGVMQNAMQQTSALVSQHYGGNVPPAGAAALSDFQKKLAAVLEPQIGWPAIQPEYVKLFVAQFPEEQLDTMLAFYKSPAGKALVEKLPSIEQEVGKTLQTRVQSLQPKVRQMFEEFQKTLPPGTAPTLSSPPASGPAAAPPATTTPAPAKSTPK